MIEWALNNLREDLLTTQYIIVIFYQDTKTSRERDACIVKSKAVSNQRPLELIGEDKLPTGLPLVK